MGTNSQGHGKQYMRLRFSCVDDVDILCQVLVENPFEDPERWKNIHKRIVEISGKEFTLRAVREHVDYLLKLFKKEDATQLRKSGTDDQYKEKQRLLQEVYDLQQEFPKRTTLSQKLKAFEPEEEATSTSTVVIKNENNLEAFYDINEENTRDSSPEQTPDPEPEPEPEQELKKRRLMLEEQKLQLEERKVAMEERRIALEEKRIALETLKHDDEKMERSKRMEIEMKERMAYLKSMEQQQKMLSFLMKQFSGEEC